MVLPAGAASVSGRGFARTLGWTFCPFCVESRDFPTRRGPATRGAMRFGVRDRRRSSWHLELVSGVIPAGTAWHPPGCIWGKSDAHIFDGSNGRREGLALSRLLSPNAVSHRILIINVCVEKIC
jgi:hypothetical protein